MEQLEDRTCPDGANPNAPILDAIANQSDFENDSIQITASATDPNQDAITYSAAGLPPGLSIHPTTGVISGTIDYTASGENGGIFNSSVTATDTTSLSDTEYFTWTVTNTARTLHWLFTGSGLGDGTVGANWTNNTEPASGDILIFDAGSGDCDLRDFGASFLVDGLTTEVDFTSTVKLPSGFNIGDSGLQMNAGALEIDTSLNLLGESVWSGGDLNSAAATAADLNILAYFRVPVPTGNTIPVRLKNATNFIVHQNKTAEVNVEDAEASVEIKFEKGAGVQVQSGAEFKFIGQGFTELSKTGLQVGTFEVKAGGKCTVDKDGGQARIDLYFRQTGADAETAIKTGDLLLRGVDAQNNTAVISGGRVVIYGGAMLDAEGPFVGSGYAILFQTGSALMTVASDATDKATIWGKVKVDGGSINLDGAGVVGYLQINGDFEFNGTMWITVDFANMDQDLINVTGTATLAGTLAIDKKGNYAANKTFRMLNAGNRVGQFGTVNPAQGYTVEYGATGVDIKT